MKTLKQTSKVAQRFIGAYEKSDYCDINQVYTTYSANKRIAQNYCTTLMQKEGGYGFRILSWNTFQFTCAWCAKGGLRIETARNSYFINLNLPF